SEVYMVGAFASYYVARFAQLDSKPGLTSFAICLVTSMVICSLLGLTIERLAYRPLRNAPKLNVLITAIGVSLFLQSSGQVVFGADPKVFPQVLEDSALFQWDMIEVRLFDIVILLVAFISMMGLHFLIQKTKTGKAIRAVSHSPRTATL